ncbi:ADP-ribosyl-[dinitrogen reductase] glycohydrolase [Methanobrevibacter oralis]|uniref:ADP-ribosyl-[dinitrogen reductase] glycohydrolase n=1 Tax=Methanobrevibacter oralis TaxID=66851 RepID=A0A166BJU7_METOA|nr:ADP-ribosylglycohydrolase family protein [Methanobrevibacter oralis]KZX13458.1 ADP-ribosyl-[dinitrogen reductase] glycohydrolase [Methanobrevibacter oralis]
MKVKDGICGLIVGDALGVPVEFKLREYLETHPVTDMIGYGTYNQPPGTFSDDSSMTIATMASIVNKKAIDYEDIQHEFSLWIFKSKYTPYGETFDFGNTTSYALMKYKQGIPALECGCGDERDNGNGSLMRILPLAFIPDIDYETIENVSGLTHSHERSKISCVFYILIAKSMLENDLSINEHVKLAGDKIKSYYKNSNELHHFNRIFNDNIKTVSSRGYVIDTFESVIYCLKNTDNYKDAVLKAVNLGGDTDTIAAICGGLAGIYYGFDDIPIDWLRQITKIDKVYSLCEKYEEFINEYY